MRSIRHTFSGLSLFVTLLLALSYPAHAEESLLWHDVVFAQDHKALGDKCCAASLSVADSPAAKYDEHHNVNRQLNRQFNSFRVNKIIHAGKTDKDGYKDRPGWQYRLTA